MQKAEANGSANAKLAAVVGKLKLFTQRDINGAQAPWKIVTTNCF